MISRTTRVWGKHACEWAMQPARKLATHLYRQWSGNYYLCHYSSWVAIQSAEKRPQAHHTYLHEYVNGAFRRRQAWWAENAVQFKTMERTKWRTCKPAGRRDAWITNLVSRPLRACQSLAVRSDSRATKLCTNLPWPLSLNVVDHFHKMFVKARW